MKESRAAIRYAKAVLDQANHANISEVVFGDMKSIQETLAGSKSCVLYYKALWLKQKTKNRL